MPFEQAVSDLDVAQEIKLPTLDMSWRNVWNSTGDTYAS
jgi:hypothetical protein